MRRFILGASCMVAGFALLAVTAPGCGSDDDNGSSGSSSGASGSSSGFNTSTSSGSSGGCVGPLCANLVKCDDPNVTTTLTGTVFDPAGKVPIFNAIVYIPQDTPAPLTTGPSCDRCDAKVSGTPLRITSTDTSGHFKLENIPVMADMPLVVQIGKWRRQVKVPMINKCVENPADATLTRLPKNRNEGDIPAIAIATGAADPLQCLFRKMGVDDSEFGVKGGPERIHLYQGGGHDTAVAQDKLASGTAFTNAEGLWGSVDELKKYDMIVMACEGTENDTAQHKPASAKQALYDYAKAGGRVFTTHYHHTFFSTATAPADEQAVATWEGIPEPQPPALPNNPATTAVNADIVGTFEKALKMKEWLTNQNALVSGQLPLYDARDNLSAATAGKALDWIDLKNTNNGGKTAVEYLTFNAPVGAPDDQICGRVVFSDLHVGAGTPADDPTNASAFPTGCHSTDLSAQQKALEFMLFDLSSCIQNDATNINPPR